MRDLRIDAIEDEPLSPAVFCNVETGVCEIFGESYSEDSYDFYAPVIKWLKDYINEYKKDITLNLKLAYYDTKSSKSYFKMFKIFKEYIHQGGNVTINWFYKEGDIDTIEEVEDFIIITGLKINLVRY